MSERVPVFVYGTLRAGGTQHARMENSPLLGSGCTPGRLYRVDWFPALLTHPAGIPIFGEVYLIDGETLARLDEFEGSEYRRVSRKITMDGGMQTEAWLWEWSSPVAGLEEISGGDWLQAAGCGKSPPVACDLPPLD